jgi:gliding motility-associated-like protein
VYAGQSYNTQGNYTVNLKTTKQCDSIIQLYARVVKQPVANFTAPEHACYGQPITISNTWYDAASTFNWLTPNAEQQGQTNGNIILNYTAEGVQNIYLTITPPAPCVPVSAAATVTIHRPLAQIMIAYNDSVLCKNQAVNLVSKYTNNYTYNWYPAELFNSTAATAQALISESTQAILQVKDMWNCTAADTVNLRVEPCCKVYMPNVFTPNADGINDYAKATYSEDVLLLKFIIFNQFGQQVFSTTDKNHGWSGIYNGKDGELDTYFYLLEYKCNANGEVQIMKGDLLLVR